MSWSRIKTILIILFLVTDIFLAVSIFTAEKKETEVSPAVFGAAVQLLEEHNITLGNAVTLPKISSAPILQADNAVTDYDGFARLILGENFLITEDNIYTSNIGELSFWGDRFSFKAKKNSAQSESITQKAAQKALFSYMKSIGVSTSGAKVISASENGGIWQFKVRDFTEKMPVFSSELIAAISKDGILSLSGSWFNLKDTREQSGEVKSALGLLIDFAESYGSPAEITDVELGYSVFDNDNYHKSASLIPVDKFVLNASTEYFTDARGPE